MTRFAYRHGPSQGRHVQTTHPRTNMLYWNKFRRAGKLGWCQLHDSEVPATKEATWRDPATGDCYDIVVCDDCAHCEELT